MVRSGVARVTKIEFCGSCNSSIFDRKYIEYISWRTLSKCAIIHSQNAASMKIAKTFGIIPQNSRYRHVVIVHIYYLQELVTESWNVSRLFVLYCDAQLVSHIRRFYITSVSVYCI